MATASSFRAAEDFLADFGSDVDLVPIAKRKALELRAEAGEATLKLSERAADSADAVLKAARILQNLNLSLHDVQADLRDLKAQLRLVLSQVEPSASKKATDDRAPQQNADQVPSVDSNQKKKTDKIAELLSKRWVAAVRNITLAATSSVDWLGSISRSSDCLLTELQKGSFECARDGSLGRFPSWSARLTKWYVEECFFPAVLMSAWSGRQMVKGEVLTEDQWRRLAQALKEAITCTAEFSYLFVAQAEYILQTFAASLLQRARQDVVLKPDMSFDDPQHPLRRAIARLMPCLSCHKMIAESLGPIVLVRCSIFLQEMDQARAAEVRLALNQLLIDASLCLY